MTAPTSAATLSELSIRPVRGLPEVHSGDDLAALIAAAVPDLQDGDVLVVTSKIVSKAEGQSRQMAREEAIDAETVRVVASRGNTRIVETRHGLVMAAAGVDASNVVPGTVVLLPVDPDASARRLRAALADRAGVRVAVIVSDTMGRPWREGLVDVAIGCAGLHPVDDLRGRTDPYGNELGMTVTAVADELAAAGELVKGKLGGVPVAVIRGAGAWVTVDDGPGSRTLVRSADNDMFRLGTAEAIRAGQRSALAAISGVWTAQRSRAGGAAAAPPQGASARSATPNLGVIRSAVEAAAEATASWMGSATLFLLEDSADRSQLRGHLATDSQPYVVVSASAADALTAGASVAALLIALAAEGVVASWRPTSRSEAAAAAAVNNSPEDVLGVILIGEY